MTPTKKSVDDGELKQLKRTSLVKTSSFKSGEIANLVNSPTPPKSPITDDEVSVIGGSLNNMLSALQDLVFVDLSKRLHFPKGPS